MMTKAPETAPSSFQGLLVNLLIDLTYTLVDPRIRY